MVLYLRDCDLTGITARDFNWFCKQPILIFSYLKVVKHIFGILCHAAPTYPTSFRHDAFFFLISVCLKIYAS